jgi:hypothetical protein
MILFWVLLVSLQLWRRDVGCDLGSWLITPPICDEYGVAYAAGDGTMAYGAIC